MKCTRQVEYRAASFSAGGNCVQPGFHTADSGPDCGQVHVINSRVPGRVVDVPHTRWIRLVAAAQASRRVNLGAWFPSEEYGDFAASFTPEEEAAFERGILAGEMSG